MAECKVATVASGIAAPCPGCRAAGTTKPGQSAISAGRAGTGSTSEMPTAISRPIIGGSRDRSTWGFGQLAGGDANFLRPTRMRDLRSGGALGGYLTEHSRRMAETAPIEEVCTPPSYPKAGIVQTTQLQPESVIQGGWMFKSLRFYVIAN